MCEEETASSRAFQGDGTTGVRIKEHGGEDLGISLHRFLFFFWFLHPFARICFFQRLLPLRCLSLPFITTGCLCTALEESALGSWCDTVMRGDVVIQQFQPKGHICSLSFALRICPNLPFSIYLLRMHSAVSAAAAPSAHLPPTLHKYQISTDYIPVLTFKYDSWSRVLLLAGKMSCSPPCG